MVILCAEYRCRHLSAIRIKLPGLLTAALDPIENSVLPHGFVGKLVYLILALGLTAHLKFLLHLLLIIMQIVTRSWQLYYGVENGDFDVFTEIFQEGDRPSNDAHCILENDETEDTCSDKLEWSKLITIDEPIRIT